ncbi:MAG TPA: alpha/beta hydrolase family protein [Methylomirabilota bacterium]|nr:alpha/beta hydrolase family protein [Methylomirabilota bacterium]
MRAAGLALLLLAACATASPPKTAGTASRAVSFRSAGYDLEGTLTSPDGRAATAGVLIVGGSGPVDRDGVSRIAVSTPPIYRWWAEGLAAAGFTVFRYDKRFVTHPSIDVASFDQEAQIADALAALSALRAARETAGHPIFVIGHSEGGTLAPVVAARAGALAGVALINSVVFPVDDLLVAQLDANPAISKAVVTETRNRLDAVKDGSFPPDELLLGAGVRYWKQWIDYSTSAKARLSELGPALLLVQCSRDQTLPGATLGRNRASMREIAAKNPRARFQELAGHDHFALRPGERAASPELMSLLIGWLQEAAR